jgi:hypothetical protein
MRLRVQIMSDNFRMVEICIKESCKKQLWPILRYYLGLRKITKILNLQSPRGFRMLTTQFRHLANLWWGGAPVLNYAMKTREVHLCAFLTLALDGGGWSAS